ncbi:hypothetical protein [Stenotrophomonas sp.]|uniref:hypothetical protein n=1 Tax=Stenotrophomonas sp. TaxID=69392 RepID=UPI002FC6AB1C
MSPEVCRLALAPAASYRPWQATYATLAADGQRWLNQALIAQHALPMPATLALPACPLARRLVQQWAQLPQVAVLIAAARLRRHVLAERASLRLPATVHTFLRLGHAELDPAHAVPADPANPQMLLGWGGARLQTLAPHLPAWIAARLGLPFAGLPLAAAGAERPDPALIDLFWSALRHVENLP